MAPEVGKTEYCSDRCESIDKKRSKAKKDKA